MRLTLKKLSLGGVEVRFARAWIDVTTRGTLLSWSGHVLGSDASSTIIDSEGWDLSVETIDGQTAQGRVLVPSYSDQSGDFESQGTGPLRLDGNG